MGKKHKKLIDSILDGIGQEMVNRGYEKSWSTGKTPLEEINKSWKKMYGRNNSYKKTPKYDPSRGLGGGEGLGNFLNSLFDLF